MDSGGKPYVVPRVKNQFQMADESYCSTRVPSSVREVQVAHSLVLVQNVKTQRWDMVPMFMHSYTSVDELLFVVQVEGMPEFCRAIARR